MKKIPFMLIIGDKEQEEEKVSVRKHGEGDQGRMDLADFISQIVNEAAIP